jgi:hypothetical protein
MTLGNMREQGVRGLAVYCLNHACPHRTVINVDDYPREVEVPSFGRRMRRPPCRCQAKLERAGQSYRLTWPLSLG